MLLHLCLGTCLAARPQLTLSTAIPAHCDQAQVYLRSELQQVSIVPRGAAALGFAQYLPSENMLMTVQQMTDMMCMALGGRAAEQVMLGKISTGTARPHLATRQAFA